MTDYTLHCPVCNQQLTGQIDAETEEARCPECEIRTRAKIHNLN